MGAAKPRDGASGISAAMRRAPLRREMAMLIGEETSSERSTIASTNAASPAAFTLLTKPVASMPTASARALASDAARLAPTRVLSMPIRFTGRCVTTASPRAPTMSPRFGARVVRSSVSPSSNEGSTTDGSHTATQPSPSRSSRSGAS